MLASYDDRRLVFLSAQCTRLLMIVEGEKGEGKAKEERRSLFAPLWGGHAGPA